VDKDEYDHFLDKDYSKGERKVSYSSERLKDILFQSISNRISELSILIDSTDDQLSTLEPQVRKLSRDLEKFKSDFRALTAIQKHIFEDSIEGNSIDEYVNNNLPLIQSLGVKIPLASKSGEHNMKYYDNPNKQKTNEDDFQQEGGSQHGRN